MFLDMGRIFKIKGIIAVTVLTVVFFCNFSFSSDRYVEVSLLSNNFKDLDAIKNVIAGEKKVANAAWWGFDGKDSTHAIQGAINSGAEKVIIPYVGKDWIVTPIKLVSNQDVVFEPGVVVVARKDSFKGINDSLFSAVDVNNITLTGYGATLRMRKKDYTGSAYSKSEHRHALQIRCSQNITVLGLRLESSGGDGVYIGSKDDKREVPCKNILIKDCVCDDNYRQGISVTSADKLRIENCVLTNTKGTPPQAGIDIEPGNPAGMLVDVVVRNCFAEYNGGSGFFINISRLTKNSRDVSVLFENCYSRKSAAPGLRVRADIARNRPKGQIEFNNCVSEDIAYSGVSVIWELTSDIVLRFKNCKLTNVAQRRDQSPIHIKMRKHKKGDMIGGVEFVNCYVYDDKKRPFLSISGFDGDEGYYNVRGNINVYNDYGARIDAGKTNLDLPLKARCFSQYK